MEEFTPIAMKCTQEQFEAIKLKLGHLKIMCIDPFFDCNYLVNNLSNETKLISNVTPNSKGHHNRKVYDEWNEEIFLKACGIGAETTLIEQLQKAEAEVKRLKEVIEDIKIKVGDWVFVKDVNIFYKKSIEYASYTNEKKITNPELIKLLEQEIK